MSDNTLAAGCRGADDGLEAGREVAQNLESTWGARPAVPSPAHTRGDRIASGCARGSRRPRWRVAAAVCRSGSTRDGADDDCCARGAAGVSRPHNACAVQERWATPPRRYAGSARLVDSGDRRFVSAVRVPGSPRSLGATPPPAYVRLIEREREGERERERYLSYSPYRTYTIRLFF